MECKKYYKILHYSKFPSPIGELHFSILVNSRIILDRLMFPSPIGELHFSILLRQAIDEALNEFPSPIGELHFSMLDISPVQYPEPQVSVPYRGATFLNNPLLATIRNFVYLFPSPIGELHFSILFEHCLYLSFLLFPSPIGELHFSIFDT